MYPKRSSAPINQNISYPRHTSRMNTLAPPAFDEQHLSNPNGPIHPLYNPSLQMYPGHHIQNQGFLVHPRSVVYNVPLFYPRTSDVNTLVPPSLGQPPNENSYGQLYPVVSPGYQMNPAGYEMQQMQPGFRPQNAATDGALFYENELVNPADDDSYGQLYPVVSPGYQMNPAGYEMQQMQPGFGPQNAATDGALFYENQLVNPADDDNMQPQQNVVMNDPVNQSPDQAPTQEVPEQTSAEEEELVVELEESLFPNSTSRGRLRWTVELQKRFARAANELGGYFKATPKKLLERMNVRGLTREQLKSHLQKVRNKIAAMPNPAVAEDSRAPQNQENMQRSSRYASQFSEDNEVYLGIIDNELYVDNKPNVESANGEAEGLHRSSEAANNNTIGPVEDLTPGLNLENFNLPGNLPSIQNDNADDGVVALLEDPLGSLDFQDSGLNNYSLPDFEFIPTDIKDFGIIDWLEDPVGYYLQSVQNCPYYSRNLRNALGEDEIWDIVFKDSDFSWIK